MTRTIAAPGLPQQPFDHGLLWSINRFIRLAPGVPSGSGQKGRRVKTWCVLTAACLNLLVTVLFAVLTAPPAWSQNLIVQDGWQGFAVRGADGAFERCVLYNRSIDALNASPYDMLGVTRDKAGQLGLMVFFQPRALTRGHEVPVSLKLDQGAPVRMTGDVLSDFHVVVAGAVPTETIEALTRTQSLEVTVQDKTLKIALTGVGAVLERLKACVATYAR